MYLYNLLIVLVQIANKIGNYILFFAYTLTCNNNLEHVVLQNLYATADI
jgi:hypothetical protein